MYLYTDRVYNHKFDDYINSTSINTNTNINTNSSKFSRYDWKIPLSKELII